MRLSRYEKNWLRGQKRQAAMQGKGLYIYENNTSGELILSRPTKSGIVKVGKGEQFQGDDYYMFMVRNNELKHIKTLEHPSQNDSLNEGTNNMNEKLITEQPPVVTNEGTVEFVTQNPSSQQKLNENKPTPQPQPDVLLNENPLDGIEIL